MIVGTAGHIDHGKTALIKALTGVDADRLKEEKARGITIDLGYAYSSLPSGDVLGFIDVPGHEKFIHNMLAGATGIDFALLVVAADDGPRPQTIEHLQILDLLGLTQGMVALTKTDLVTAERQRDVIADIGNLLEATSLRSAPVFPISCRSGAGIEELRAHLESEAAGLAARSVHGGFRLAVDRSFTIAGTGTVVTGTVLSGQVGVGDRLVLSPSGIAVRIRGLHAQNRPADLGVVGQRCALNLAGIEKQDVQRGDWVVAQALNAPTRRLDVRLRLLASESKPLRHWSAVHLHVGAAHVMGHVALLQSGHLAPGESGHAQLVLDAPVCAVSGDRCILRDASAQRTMAGAVVIDAHPPNRGRRTPQRLALLAALELGNPAERLSSLLDLSPEGLDVHAFALNANLTAAEFDELSLALDARRVDGTGSYMFSESHWCRLLQSVVAALQAEHDGVPDSLGLNSEQLRLRTAPRLDRTAFGKVLNDGLEQGNWVRDGSWWHLPGHTIVLGREDEALWQRLRPRLVKQPFQPPRVRDIARIEGLDEAAVRKLLMRVARTGQVYKVAHDHYFSRQAVIDLANIVREIIDAGPDTGVSAAPFRDRIGTGRKLAIQILEFFDRVGFTRRTGDIHRMRNPSLGF